MHKIIVIFLIITSVASAQEAVSIKGKLLNKNQAVDQVSVYNISNRSGTVTDRLGAFTIFGNVGDTLQIRAVQYETAVVIVTEKIINERALAIFMMSSVNELDTVQLSNSILTGDINKDGSANELDPAKINNNPDSSNPISTENRRLHTATSRPEDQVGQNNLRFDISLDRVLNALSGRTKRLKKAIAVSEFQKKVERVRNYYSDSLFMTTLHIPQGYIDDFTMRVLDDEALLKDVRLDNKLYALEYFMTRWEVYRDLIEKQGGDTLRVDPVKQE